MSGPPTSCPDDLATAPDWQVLLNHFEFMRGFAFVVLLVPDDECTAICKSTLARHLEQRGRHLWELPVEDTESLEGIADSLLSAAPRADLGGVWIAKAVPDQAEHFPMWFDAWRSALGKLNQHAHPLTQKWNAPLLVVGAPWLQQVFLEYAPDLWSIRTLVARITKESVPSPIPQRHAPGATVAAQAVASPDEPDIDLSSPTPSLVFVSYSRKDRRWLDRLMTALKPLVRQQSIDCWDDKRIQAGTHWRAEIRRALAAASVAVLLVSDDFLASDFIYENELPPLLEAAENDEVAILWVAVRHSQYKNTKLWAYQAANNPDRPFSSLRSWERDRDLVVIAEQIVQAARRRPSKGR